MGAESRVDMTTLPETATKAEIEETFSTMQSQAAWESGHGGYTGTIAEARGCEIQLHRKFDDREAASRAKDEFVEKWGPAVAILVKDKTGAYKVAFAGCYSC